MTPEPHSSHPVPEAWRSRGAVALRPEHRLAWVDMLRGAALAGMLVYHGAWDLHAFGLVDTDPSRNAGWLLFGRCVAGLFLALSGFGLGLAARQGVARRASAVRLGRIAAAAALVSLATWVAVPDAPVWFGILHCIVVTNAVALALRRWSSPALVAVAVAASTAPLALRGIVGPGWSWTGLAASEPATLDFRPVLPWLAPVLLGMVLGRTPLATVAGSALRRVPPPLRLWAWAGRHSLLVYLGHQPLMIGALAIALGATPQHAAVEALRKPEEATAFLQRCRDTCAAGGGDQELCRSTCHCVLTSAISHTALLRPGWRWFSRDPAQSLEGAVALCRRSESTGKP